MKPLFGGFPFAQPLYTTALQWFFAMHCAVGAYQRGMVLSMGDVDSWQEVFMQNYSCGDCFEVMAFRYFFYDLSFN